MRISTGHRGAALLVASALTFGACGDGQGDGDVEAGRPEGFEATPDYLSQVVEKSTSLRYRFEALVSMGIMEGFDASGVEDIPAMTGASDGSRVYQRTDMEAMLEAMVGMDSGERLPFDLDEVDLSIETVADDHTVYLRAPDFDVIAEARVGETPPPLVDALEGLGDHWGRVDLDTPG